MTMIEQKLINAYTVLVMANKYIIKEEDRISSNQLLVPLKFQSEVEIKVAERTIKVLEGVVIG